MNGKGIQYLNDIFKSSEEQTFKDFEIIVSDHSENNDIKDYCSSLNYSFPILYYKNKENIGSSSSNFNNAILKAKGKYIKILCQDDFFFDVNGLKKIKNSIESNNSSWIVCGSIITDKEKSKFYNTINPSYNNNIIYGYNSIGAPSVLTFKNDKNLFDNELIWLMDCDMYYRLFNKYGYPNIIIEPIVAVRDWDGSVSRTIADGSIRVSESNYIKKKYNLEN
jgi:hypothetical protein